jgi:hypothetical protein
MQERPAVNQKPLEQRIQTDPQQPIQRQQQSNPDMNNLKDRMQEQQQKGQQSTKHENPNDRH